MELLYQGTAAAEGIPSFFCTCEVCALARAKGGREIRQRSSALLDGVLKLDFGPDSYRQMLDIGENYANLRSVLITHSHDDHFSVGDLSCRRRGFADLPDGTPPLTVYGNERVGEMLRPFLGDRLAFTPLSPFEPVQIEGYTVTALEAVHCVNYTVQTYPIEYEGKTLYRSENAFFYLIEKDGSSLLYAHDTDEFTQNDLEYLKGRHIRLISLDCTSGIRVTQWIGHMCIPDCLNMREKLLACGAADENTIFVANHFSHNGYTTFEDIQSRLPGFVIAQDGLRLEF